MEHVMKRAGVGLGFLVLLAGCPSKEDDAHKDAGPHVAGKLQEGVVAEGMVVPLQYSALSLPVGGTLREVLTDEGQQVKAGQVLARLDTRELEARLANARAEVARAQANLRQLKAGARDEEIAVKEAQLRQNSTEVERERNELRRLERLKEKGAVAEQDLERARSSVARVEANRAMVEADMNLLKAGSRPEAVGVAEAGVSAARAAVTQVEAALALTELKAPFAGTVAYLDLRAGEFAPPGTPVLRLADLGHWVIRTEDLTELAVVKVHKDAKVALTFDAIPGLELPGTVTHVRAFGERKKGDMTYTVVIEPEQQDARLRWNMTASVRIASAGDAGPVPAAINGEKLAR